MSDTPTREREQGPVNDRRDERPLHLRYWQSWAAPYGNRGWQHGNLGPNHRDHMDGRKPRAVR